MQGGGRDGWPVLVIPPALTFYTGHQETHRQIITLYNPFQFPIAYSVLCNRPSCYQVEPSQGVLRENSTQSMIVSCISVSQPSPNENHRIRILLYEEGSRNASGRRDLTLTVVPGQPPAASDGFDTDHFESVHSSDHHRQGGSTTPALPLPPNTQSGGYWYSVWQAVREGPSPSLLLVLGVVVCLAGLLMPTEGEETQTTIPPYLHLHANIKIVIAYALGLLTYAILRPM